MRLLHVVPTYFPAVRYGGPIYSVHGLCAALAARGHDVHVFTTNVDGPGDSVVPLGQPVDMDGVKVWYFPSRWLRRLYWSPPMARMLKLEVGGFDLVHLHSVFLWPTWAAARAARRRVPYVLSPRGMLVKDLVRARSRVRSRRAWIALIERANLARAAGIHVTSAVEEAELEEFGFTLSGRIFDVPNGVVPSEPLPQHEPGRAALSGDAGSHQLEEAHRHRPRSREARRRRSSGDRGRRRRRSGAAAARSRGVAWHRGARRVRRTRRRLAQAAVAAWRPGAADAFAFGKLRQLGIGGDGRGHAGDRRFPQVGIADSVRESGSGLRRGAPTRRHLPMPSGNCRPSADLRARMGERARATVAAHYSWDVDRRAHGKTSIARSLNDFQQEPPRISAMPMLDQITPLILTLDEEGQHRARARAV